MITDKELETWLGVISKKLAEAGIESEIVPIYRHRRIRVLTVTLDDGTIVDVAEAPIRTDRLAMTGYFVEVFENQRTDSWGFPLPGSKRRITFKLKEIRSREHVRATSVLRADDSIGVDNMVKQLKRRTRIDHEDAILHEQRCEIRRRNREAINSKQRNVPRFCDVKASGLSDGVARIKFNRDLTVDIEDLDDVLEVLNQLKITKRRHSTITPFSELA